MRTLFDGIPLDEMNTSMTINATAMWLLALYVALADEHGVRDAQLAGTTQNDIVKEYLSRGTYIFPPERVAAPHRRPDRVHRAARARVEPDQRVPVPPAGGGRDAGAGARVRARQRDRVLDAVRDSGRSRADEFPEVVGRISFFIDAGIRFVEEMCKMRAFTEMWDDICRDRYGVTDPKLRRFRYGMQVNFLLRLLQLIVLLTTTR